MNGGRSRPHFTIATQSVSKLSPERVKYYREHPGCRAVAYYMDGYMTALLDGHHKAMAAALNHQMVSALVICPCYPYKIRQEDGSMRAYNIKSGDIVFACEEYGLEEITKNVGEQASFTEMENIQKMILKGPLDFKLPYDSKALVSYYPNVEEIAIIDAVGDISDERLNQIISGEIFCSNDEICELIKALGGLKHRRLLEIADYFLLKCTYTAKSRYHNVDVIITIVKELIRMPRTEELEQYLIDVMVELENEYASVREIILDYL